LRIRAFFALIALFALGQNGSSQHVMEIYTNMGLLVCAKEFGEGYHVLLVGDIATLSNMRRPCTVGFPYLSLAEI
jgi:hypothetical protein